MTERRMALVELLRRLRRTVGRRFLAELDPNRRREDRLRGRAPAASASAGGGRSCRQITWRSGAAGVGAVTLAAVEVIAVDAVRGFQMADDRLDRGAALHLAADRSGHPPHLTGDPDAECVGVMGAAIARSTGMRRVSTPVGCSNSAPTGPQVWGPQVRPSNGLPCSALACSTNRPPRGLVAGVRSLWAAQWRRPRPARDRASPAPRSGAPPPGAPNNSSAPAMAGR